MARRHFEAIAHRNDGRGFALVSSSLTGRVWDGSMWVFNDYADFHNCPNLDMVSTRTRTGISDVLWLINQKDLVLACDSGELEVWSCGSPGNTLTFTASVGSHDDMVVTVKQLAEPQSLASGGADGKVILWDIESKNLIKSFRGHCGAILSISTNPNSPSTFITTGQDSMVLLWDLRAPSPATKVTACRNNVYMSSAWDQHNVALGSEAGCIEVYDVRGDPLLYAAYTPHTRPVRRLTFAPWNSALLASVSDDRSVMVKVLTDNNVTMVSRDHVDFVRDASWDTVECVLLTCGWDGQLLKHSLDQLGDMSGVKSIESCDHHVEQVMNSHDVDMKSADPQSTTVPPGKEPTIDMFAEQVSELDPAA